LPPYSFLKVGAYDRELGVASSVPFRLPHTHSLTLYPEHTHGGGGGCLSLDC